MSTTPRHRKPRKSVAELLQARLSAELGWAVALPKRTYAGKWQLERFCASWAARGGPAREVFSIYTMTECLKASKLKITWNQRSMDWDVEPVN